MSVSVRVRVVVVVVVTLVAVDGARANEWCDEVGRIAAREGLDHAGIEEATALVPDQRVQSKVRALAAKEHGIALAGSALATIARVGCPPPDQRDGRVGSAEAAQLASTILTDPRFGGVRVGDDALDRLLDRIWVSIGRLLESKGMQRYATGARAIYLGLLVVVVAAVLGRLVTALVRARGLLGAREDDARKRARIAVERRRSFAELRARAADALARGQARSAIDLAMQALLARVGESAQGVAAASRTPREVAAALDERARGADGPALRDAVRVPLTGFERVAFAKAPDVDDARAFLADVDRAEAQMAQRGD